MTDLADINAAIEQVCALDQARLNQEVKAAETEMQRYWGAHTKETISVADYQKLAARKNVLERLASVAFWNNLANGSQP